MRVSEIKVSYSNKNPEKIKEELGALDGIIVPGGFGSRGIEGKIKAIKDKNDFSMRYNFRIQI